jgi:hypothetical protein
MITRPCWRRYSRSNRKEEEREAQSSKLKAQNNTSIFWVLS